jgi:glycosyltransferase involved in cell wall biosynthesis
MTGPVVFVVPGRLDTLTGGSIYDRRMVEGLRARGWSVDVRELGDGFPRPAPEALAHAAGVFASLADGVTAIVDGLALGAMPAIVEQHSRRLRIVALVHLPLALEVGLDRDAVRELEASERRALRAAEVVVVTGPSTTGELARYGVSGDRVVVVEPGTDPAPLASGGDGVTLQLLSIATLSPGKGHEVLVRALGSIATGDWALTCVGNLTRYPATVARVRQELRAAGLAGRVALVGELSGAELESQWSGSDLFVLATLRETYGMAVAEALARGLPVVSTTTGSIPEVVGPDAGLLVPPGDERALADALSQVIGDAALRARLAAGARRVRDRLQTWDSAAARMSAVLERVPANG